MRDGFHLKHYNEFIEAKVHKSLKYTSKDDSKRPIEYMSEKKTKVIDYDEVKKNYFKDHGMQEGDAKSVDALYMLKNKLCMVEFKNGDFNSSEIMEKALSSVMMFMDITGCSLSDFRKDSIFILVYNSEVKKPNARQIASVYKARSSGGFYSLFQLDHLQGFCFGKVCEIEKDNFDSSEYSNEIIAY